MKVKNPSILKGDYYENVTYTKNKKFPLIIYSHGYNAYVEYNTFLCCQLASNGYIVASVGHAYEAVENEYENGSFDLYDRHINKIMYNKGILKTIFDQKKALKSKGTSEELFWKYLKIC